MTGVAAVQARNNTTIDSGGGGASAHTVVRGDTMWDIARAKGVSLQSLIAANPQIRNPDLIFPGQKLTIPGGNGGVGGTGGTGGVGGTNPGGGSSDIAATAEKYLGQNASSLKTNRSDGLPMDPSVPNNVCCANFVSAVLIESGHLKPGLHDNTVEGLKNTLRSEGWQEVPLSQAKPGDVVIMQDGISHTEIVTEGGKMIGSNNSNPDGSQRIGHDSLSYAAQHGGIVLRAPGGSQGTEGTGGTQGTGGVTPTGQGSRQDKIDQAMSFFQSQGWSKAQAAGIVANLDAESGMQANIQQHGGGPAYGLAQWEGPRQADFKAWAGKDIRQSTFAEQLRFIQHELTGSERSAGNALKQVDDPRTAAATVCRLYERPADIVGDSATRAAIAARIYAGN